MNMISRIKTQVARSRRQSVLQDLQRSPCNNVRIILGCDTHAEQVVSPLQRRQLRVQQCRRHEVRRCAFLQTRCGRTASRSKGSRSVSSPDTHSRTQHGERASQDVNVHVQQQEAHPAGDGLPQQVAVRMLQRGAGQHHSCAACSADAACTRAQYVSCRRVGSQTGAASAAGCAAQVRACWRELLCRLPPRAAATAHDQRL